MTGNTIKTRDGRKFKVVDKVLSWRWVQEPKRPLDYVLVQETKYLCVTMGPRGAVKTKVEAIPVTQIEEIF